MSGPPTPWAAPTARDQLEARALPVPGTLRCPGLPGHRCGRRIMPMMLQDVSALPAALTSGAAWLCDACLEWLYQTTRVDRATVAQAQGAPAAWVAWREAKLAGDPHATGRGRPKG